MTTAPAPAHGFDADLEAQILSNLAPPDLPRGLRRDLAPDTRPLAEQSRATGYHLVACQPDWFDIDLPGLGAALAGTGCDPVLVEHGQHAVMLRLEAVEDDDAAMDASIAARSTGYYVVAFKDRSTASAFLLSWAKQLPTHAPQHRAAMPELIECTCHYRCAKTPAACALSGMGWHLHDGESCAAHPALAAGAIRA